MNKKFLSVVLFGALMAGSSVTFTGCIDNDEPAGIENLRGAKAELLRAKVAVEAANAALVNAQAEKVKAEAEQIKAAAEITKAQAENVKLQNELLAAQNEEEKARIEAQIAKYQQQIESDALIHQTAMVNYQKALVEAQRSYELALKQIEIAQATASDSEKVTLGELKLAVTTAQGVVDTKITAVETAEEAYYNAVLESKNDSVNFKRLELAIVRKKAEQTSAEETLAKWQGFLKEDTETADWRKEITTLEDSITGLVKKQSELAIELAKLQNSEAYKKLIDAKDETAEAYATLKTSAKLEYKDMMKETKTVAKGTLAADAVKTIGGPDADGKGGFIKDMKDKIADYTSEKKALLDEIATQTEGDVADKKKASEKDVKAWKDATTAYSTAKDYTTEADDLKAVKAAYETYSEAMSAAGGDAKKELKAQQAFADAVVKYYNAAAPVQLTTNKVSLELTLNSKTTLVTKTVKDWLSDSDNKDVYLSALITYFGNAEKLWQTGDAEKLENDAVKTPATGALATLKSVQEILGDLQKASEKAFGKASLYGKDFASQENGYMRVEPTQAEVKAIKNYGSACGSLGAYYASTDENYQFEAKNYKEIIADYEKAVTYWTEQLTALNKALADAKTAAEAAEKALTAYEEDNFEALNIEINYEIGGRLRALRAVKQALIDAVDTWLPENGNYQDTDKFEEWLQQQIEVAEDSVIDAEEEVVTAENNLIMAKDGKYDAVSAAKKALDKAMAGLEAAQAELSTATANLQKGLEIMIGTSTAE